MDSESLPVVHLYLLLGLLAPSNSSILVSSQQQKEIKGNWQKAENVLYRRLSRRVSEDFRVENPVTETFSPDSCLFCIFLKVPCKYKYYFYPTALTLTFGETREPVRQNKRGLTELRRAVRNSPGNRAVCLNRRAKVEQDPLRNTTSVQTQVANTN